MGDEGFGAIGFTVTTPLGVFTKTLCIEKIIIPIAKFSIDTAGNDYEGSEGYYTCSNQVIHFDNLSTTNQGTAIVNYFWDFGDGTYSSEFEPNHTYTDDGTYTVYLTVYNSCSCYSKHTMRIIVKSKGFDLVCPGIICEGQSGTYSLPFEGKELCQNINESNWSVQGGQITNMNIDGDVTVIWNNINASGFGLVTFTPVGCQLECLLPTTLKIPVIQQRGTIDGSISMCVKEQGIYKMPQWPTTDFNWQVIGNENGDYAEVLLSDQRNEVIIRPLVSGPLRLRCDYQNTLLHCGGFAEMTINVNTNVTIEGPSAVCAGSSVQYTTQNGEIVKWILTKSNGTTENILNNSSTYNYTFSTAENYSLSIQSNASCIGVPKNITVLPQPTAPTISGLTEICPNSPYTYSIANPDPNSVYHWTVVNGTAVTALTGNQIIVTFSTAATHQVTVYRETQAPALCTSATVALNVINKVITAEIRGTATVCPNTNQNYEAVLPTTSTLYNAGETYIWSLNLPSLGSITAGQGTNSITMLWNNVTVPTDVILQLEVRKCTIDTIFYKTITITPQPVLTVSGTNSICSGNNGNFTVSANGFTLPNTTVIEWQFGDGSTFSSNNTSTSHLFYSTVSTNIIRYVTASYTNQQCNVTVTSEPFAVTILPGPGATASISQGVNNYCNSGDITAFLTAATTPGATIAWYNYNSNTLVGTGNNYTVTNFGLYYFIATLNGCVSRCNVLAITMYCPVPGSCTLNPEPIVENTSTNDCGILNLSGTTSVTPLNTIFDVFGPTQVTNYAASTLPVKAGLYHVYYNTYYQCSQGPLAKVALLKTVLVPYIPKFNYSVSCTGNNSFTIQVYDNSDVYTALTNVSYNYYYRLHNSSGSNPWTLVGLNTDGALNHAFTSGLYDIKLVINGDYNNNPQPACEKIIESIALQTLPSSLAITVTTAPKCHDTAVGFQVIGTLPSYTQKWTFEPGAENTLATPNRVFNESGNQNVSVEVTNASGCSVTLNQPLVIPPKCFNGDAVITSVPSSVCEGGIITLGYQSNSDVCAVNSYQWMDGSTTLSGATNSTLNVTQTGFYWLKVRSSDNCLLETPTRVAPIFRPLPSVNLVSEGTFCYNADKKITAVTGATILGWTLDGVAIPYSAGLTSINLPLIPAGTHTIGISVTQNGCTTTATHQITIVTQPTAPELKYIISKCEPFAVNISVTNPQNTGNYTWSNGANGTSIEVYNGGVYQVTYNSGGCSTSNQLIVPKNPLDYVWIFPSGCITNCEKIMGWLIGPRTPLHYWGWLENDVMDEDGVDSFPEPYFLDDSGVYNFTLQTTPGGDNGLECALTTAPLDYSLIKCDDCGIKELTQKNITPSELHFCAFDLHITLVNTSAVPLVVTIGNVVNDVIVTPSTITLSPGLNNVFLTVIPINNFNGGAVNLFFASYIDEKECMNELQVFIPSCGGDGNNLQTKMNGSELKPTRSFTLYPNPTKSQVTIGFTNLEPAVTLELYDLMGRSLYTLPLSESNGEIVIPLPNYPSGIYVVVLRSEKGILEQRKLVIE